MYGQEYRLDVVVIGQSQVYRGYNAVMIAEKLSASVYLLSSPAQTILDSYYLLRETLAHHEIGTLFLQINTASLKRLQGEGNYDSAMDLIYSMRPSLNRLQYSLEVTGYPPFIAQLAEVAKDQVGTVRSLIHLVPLRRMLESGHSRRWIPKEGRYFDRGFAPTSAALSPDAPFKPLDPPRAPDPDGLAILDRFMKLCEARGVRVVWVSSPYPTEALARLGNYDEEDRAIRRLADQYGVTYWNFNLAKPDALSLELRDFEDYRHLNLNGANKLTALFCDLVRADREGADTSGAFYARALKSPSGLSAPKEGLRAPEILTDFRAAR